MMQVALRGLWGRKLRTVLTALSIVLGTAMITGTFILRDQINNAFSDIFHESNKGIDVVLSKKTAFTSDNGTVAGPAPRVGDRHREDGGGRRQGRGADPGHRLDRRRRQVRHRQRRRARPGLLVRHRALLELPVHQPAARPTDSTSRSTRSSQTTST